MIRSIYIVILLLFVFLSGCMENNDTLKSEPYYWNNVKITGGGFVDGIVFHPKAKDLVYARTDMGGAYRKDADSKEWIPLMDWVSYKDANLMGVESIALDPNNADMLYLACGTYTRDDVPNGEILRSTNKGESFERIPVPFKMGGNENGRGNGERMTVDPNNGNIIYLGTRQNGLWKSNDGAKSWDKIDSFPSVKEDVPDSIIAQKKQKQWNWALKGSGIVVVVCDPTSVNENQESKTVYALVSLKGRNNFFVSKNAGITWQPVKGHPTNLYPNHAVLASNGMMYISYGDNPGPWTMNDGAIYKYNTKSGDWNDITPEKSIPNDNSLSLGYSSLAVDPQNPNTIIACTFHRSGSKGGDEIFRSVDGGKTWKGIMATASKYDYTKAPYTKITGIHWLFDIEINPHNPDHAIFTTGYGGHETFNLTANDRKDTVIWEIMATGIEETVPLELLSPPKGPHLISAIGDYGGFFHWDLNKVNPEGNFTNPHFGNTDGIACAESIPEIVVRVGVASYQRPKENCIGYSLDMGKTWQPTKSLPFAQSKHGHIAVSADGLVWIWTPENSLPYRTADNGKTWFPIDNIAKNTKIVADKVNPLYFYGLNIKTGYYYHSYDGGQSFDSTATGISATGSYKKDSRGDQRGGQDRIYATPGIENEMWVPAYDGLYFKNAYVKSFEKIMGVETIHAFGFGKEHPDAKYPSLYLIGTINGIRGIFRSDNQAKTWVKINNEQHQWGLLLHITGDPKKYGRVYIGTHGRGIIYGDPV